MHSWKKLKPYATFSVDNVPKTSQSHDIFERHVRISATFLSSEIFNCVGQGCPQKYCWTVPNFITIFLDILSSTFHNVHCYRSLRKRMPSNFPDINRKGIILWPEYIEWHRTCYRTACHIKSHVYCCIPRIRRQANDAGHNVIRQQVCLLRVPVFVGLEKCWNCLPPCSDLTVTDVVWLHPLVMTGIASLCSHADNSMRSL